METAYISLVFRKYEQSFDNLCEVLEKVSISQFFLKSIRSILRFLFAIEFFTLIILEFYLIFLEKKSGTSSKWLFPQRVIVEVVLVNKAS